MKLKVFWGFKNKTDIARQFSGVSEYDYSDGVSVDRIMKDLRGAIVLLAHYAYEDYSGHAYVLYEKGGKYYLNEGSHCSCFGLEGQWEPVEVLPEQLIKMNITVYGSPETSELWETVIVPALKEQHDL